MGIAVLVMGAPAASTRDVGQEKGPGRAHPGRVWSRMLERAGPCSVMGTGWGQPLSVLQPRLLQSCRGAARAAVGLEEELPVSKMTFQFLL